METIHLNQGLDGLYIWWLNLKIGEGEKTKEQATSIVGNYMYLFAFPWSQIKKNKISDEGFNLL